MLCSNLEINPQLYHGRSRILTSQSLRPPSLLCLKKTKCSWLPNKKARKAFETEQGTMEFFPKLNRNSMNSANSRNLINHWSMNWSHFKYLVSHMCLAGAVVASWSLTQEDGRFKPFYCNDKYFCHWKLLEKTQISEIIFLCVQL